jgi:hypothetical protein
MSARMVADTRNTKAARARRKRHNRAANMHDVPPALLAIISEMFLDALLGDLDNWKPTGILSAPIGGAWTLANNPSLNRSMSPHAVNAGSRT